MNILLIFFAIPLATIILSAILETFINCPFKVAGIFFSIFIVVAFAFGGTAELIVAAIIFTIISFITAVVVRLIINRQCNRCNSYDNNCCNNWDNNTCNNCPNANGISLNTATNNVLNTNALSLNNNATTLNALPEETTTLNFNTANNGCRRCR